MPPDTHSTLPARFQNTRSRLAALSGLLGLTITEFAFLWFGYGPPDNFASTLVYIGFVGLIGLSILNGYLTGDTTMALALGSTPIIIVIGMGLIGGTDFSESGIVLTVVFLLAVVVLGLIPAATGFAIGQAIQQAR